MRMSSRIDCYSSNLQHCMCNVECTRVKITPAVMICGWECLLCPRKNALARCHEWLIIAQVTNKLQPWDQPRPSHQELRNLSSSGHSQEIYVTNSALKRSIRRFVITEKNVKAVVATSI